MQRRPNQNKTTFVNQPPLNKHQRPTIQSTITMLSIITGCLATNCHKGSTDPDLVVIACRPVSGLVAEPLELLELLERRRRMRAVTSGNVKRRQHLPDPYDNNLSYNAL